MRSAFIEPFSRFRKTWLFIIALIIITLFFIFKLSNANAENISINTVQNCDANAVIYCGASSIDQLISKYNNGDGVNSAVSIHNIYAYFGVTSNDINSLSSSAEVKVGYVTSSNDVYLDGDSQPIATNAVTAGRQYISGSNMVDENGTVFYTRPPSVSFVSSPLKAYIIMNGNRFSYAILASCGNLVKATAKPTAKPPKTVIKVTKPPKTTVNSTTNITPITPTTNQVSVCSGNTTNANSGLAAQGGNCSVNTVTQNTTTPPQSTSPPTTPSTSTTSVSVTPTPPTSSTLVNTGPGSVLAIFGGTSGLGYLGYLIRLKKKIV